MKTFIIFNANIHLRIRHVPDALLTRRLPKFIIRNEKLIVFNEKLIVFDARLIIFNTESIIFNTEFIIFNAELYTRSSGGFQPCPRS